MDKLKKQPKNLLVHNWIQVYFSFYKESTQVYFSFYKESTTIDDAKAVKKLLKPREKYNLIDIVIDKLYAPSDKDIIDYFELTKFVGYDYKGYYSPDIVRLKSIALDLDIFAELEFNIKSKIIEKIVHNIIRKIEKINIEEIKTILHHYNKAIERDKRTYRSDIFTDVIERYIVAKDTYNYKEEGRVNIKEDLVKIFDVLEDEYKGLSERNQRTIIKDIESLFVECALCYIFKDNLLDKIGNYKKINVKNKQYMDAFLNNDMCYLFSRLFINKIDVESIKQNIDEKYKSFIKKAAGTRGLRLSHLLNSMLNEKDKPIQAQRIDFLFNQLEMIKNVATTENNVKAIKLEETSKNMNKINKI